MKTMEVPFFRPDITEKEINAVTDTLRSGWLTTGNVCREFEKDFQTYLGNDQLYCIAVNSATAALHLSVEAIGLKAGDEVLIPTWTFTSTAEVVRYLGAIPVFVDIDPQTYFIDFQDAEQKITSKTKAIMPVHFAGAAIPRSHINQFAKKYNLRVIEDAAHAFPVENEGALIGNILPNDLTDTVCYSFYATKTMTTGEGGMVVTKDPVLANRIRTMRLHGISRDVFDRYTSKDASWFYEIVAPGYKYNLTDLAAAMGRVQLQRAKAMAERRNQIASAYREAFQDLPVEMIPAANNSNEHAWHLFPLRIREDAQIDRDQFVKLAKEHNICCSMHFIPLHMQPYYRETFGYRDTDLPKAQKCFFEEVSLPIFSAQTDEEIESVISVVRSLLE